VKNGAELKKFKKSKSSKNDADREKQDISSLAYWGDGKNNLISVSWDRVLRMYDDGDVDREGKEKYTLTNRHSDAINHVAF